jgi:hypothetical protein
MGKSGHVNRKEPKGPQLVEAYKNVRHVFDQAGWYMYCDKLDGYHYDVVHAFTEGFDGHRVQISNLIM